VFAFAGITVLGTAGLLAGCGKTEAGNQGAAGGAPQAMPVQVIVAKLQKIPDTTEYLSVLKSRHSATINPQVEGQITKIFVKSGDRVAAGTPLLQIDPLKQQATVSSQEAAVAAHRLQPRMPKRSSTGRRNSSRPAWCRNKISTTRNRLTTLPWRSSKLYRIRLDSRKWSCTTTR